ncbi:coproporphyrinogen III oxidase [Canibacter sp. lx-45]|uniref:radical SAM family heme chaperone HemW n=1 Tax=Canibacter zhuwentaonis TaxID=2837491 RepID=UPI001BDD3B38|nr:radical SAM family heme chaperone HemW [Canibacter zhuwentaonis]MBT1035062.1 coproporphyrinogen III oxidase [Canibacter zhuwentaonis]
MPPSALLPGDPVPADGRLPAQAAVNSAERGFGAYVHVPYCRVRCGYCDFNTYTATELGSTNQSNYTAEVLQEIAFAKTALQLSQVPQRPLDTVFFGGGTPTLLPAGDLVKMFNGLKNTWGLTADAEVTTEANPDSVDYSYLEELRDAGFTRISFGMQSAVAHVLEVLERTHDPSRILPVTKFARELGLQVSLDLIYGTPHETLSNWRESVLTALACEPDHISAYALIIEPGTKLAAQIKRGKYQMPDDDTQADMYELADKLFSEAGYRWYEISNWERGGSYSRHNLGYWQGANWWGFGPGAHSHVGGVRWWNVKHPRVYAARVRAGVSPGYAQEVLDPHARHTERVLLESRIRWGLPLQALTAQERSRVAGLLTQELVQPEPLFAQQRIVPTLKGRLLADQIVHQLLG